ncbi:hypothetical protein DV736_g2495, partial [Chaetothyriales sp. CBS 134916]
MAQVEAAADEQATGGPPNPVDHTGLCLLSLDGGGVRGLSTLFILKSLMLQLNHERQKMGTSALKPCEVFDLIGGTSTGGLITIMLGRLEMDVDECITAYTQLIKNVFEEKAHRTPFSWSGRVQARFDNGKLKAAIEEVITRQGYSPTELFNDGKPRGCRVFVCTAAKDLYGITRLRSYDLPRKPSVPATITEAALATSAATGFFDPVSIGARQFVDGALGVNNPVEEVEGEASDIWCADTGELKPLVKCFVSIGTGNPGKKAVEDNLLKFLSKTLVQITTETEETTKRSVARWRQHYDQNRYYRLNVEQGLQDVGLAEYKEQGRIEAATDQYLDEQQQIFRVRNCVQNLKLKQKRAEATLAGQVHEYNISLIQSQLSRTTVSSHLIPPPNKRFVGRKAIVDTLRDKLFSSDGQKVSLVGLGGIGKTQVALQLAHWTKANKSDHSVFWVPAVNHATFIQAYTEIARKVAAQKRSEDEDIQECVRRALESSEAGKWLLVVDNADDMEVLFGSAAHSDGLFQYLPESDHGVTLFTTRSREVAVAVAVGGELVELGEMNAHEAHSLLEKSLFQKDLLADTDGVTTLLQELTYLPLAITQAAAYLNRNRVPIAEYVKLLQGTEQGVVELMSREFHDSTRHRESRHAVATTWVVSFRQIQKIDPAAADLLSYLSCIEPKIIPKSLLPPLPSEEAMIYAVGTLDGYAFLVRRGDTDTFDIHSLVHLATRIWVGREGLGVRAERELVQHVARVFPSSAYENRDRWRAYLPHALCLLRGDRTVEMRERHDLEVLVGLCLQADGRIKEAVQYLEESFRWRRDHLPSNDPSRLASQHELAIAYEANGQVKDAVQLLEEVVRIRVQTLTEDHPDRLASQHALAIAYQANGQVKDAVQLLEEVVRIKGQKLTEDHPSRLASQHALAMAYQANGQVKDVKDAVQLLEEVVRIKGQKLTEDHPDRLASQHALAMAYQANGQVKDAVQLLEEVVRIHGQTLTGDHPDRLASQHNLAMAYRANGQVKEVVQLLEEVVRIRVQTLTGDHPDRLVSQHALAIAYQANGQVKDAVQLLEEVVRIHGQTLTGDHPDRLASQHNLAMAYQANGQVKDAVQLLEEVVRIRVQTLTGDHPDRLVSQHALAIAYQANGQVKDAVQLLEEVVRIRVQTLTEDHPDRLASQHNLAMAYQANGQVKDAVQLLEEVVRIHGQTLTGDHPDRLASQHALAMAYQANGQVKEAVQLLEEVVQIEGQTLTEDHPSRLASQHALAMVYKANGQVKEAVQLLEEHALAIAYRANGQVKDAVQLLEEVVRIRVQTLTGDHPDRLASQHALAIAYRANGQVKEVVQLLEEVVRIRVQTLTEDHPDRLASQHALAMVYKANGQVKEAVQLLEEVVRIKGQTLTGDHPDRLASQHNLAIMLWKLGQYSAALQMMRRVVEIRQRVLDPVHPSRMSSEAWLNHFEDNMP